MCIALLHVNEWFWSQCYNQVIGLELQAGWRKIMVLIEIYIYDSIRSSSRDCEKEFL